MAVVGPKTRRQHTAAAAAATERAASLLGTPYVGGDSVATLEARVWALGADVARVPREQLPDEYDRQILEVRRGTADLMRQLALEKGTSRSAPPRALTRQQHHQQQQQQPKPRSRRQLEAEEEDETEDEQEEEEERSRAARERRRVASGDSPAAVRRRHGRQAQAPGWREVKEPERTTPGRPPGLSSASPEKTQWSSPARRGPSRRGGGGEGDNDPRYAALTAEMRTATATLARVLEKMTLSEKGRSRASSPAAASRTRAHSPGAGSLPARAQSPSAGAWGSPDSNGHSSWGSPASNGGRSRVHSPARRGKVEEVEAEEVEEERPRRGRVRSVEGMAHRESPGHGEASFEAPEHRPRHSDAPDREYRARSPQVRAMLRALTPPRAYSPTRSPGSLAHSPLPRVSSPPAAAARTRQRARNPR